MLKRLAKSRERRKKAASKRERGKVVWRDHRHKRESSSSSSLFFRRDVTVFPIDAQKWTFPCFRRFFRLCVLKGCRPKGTKGTTPAVLLRVQTPPPTSRILRRGFQTTMSGATEESVVPAALWSRVDAAPGVRTMMVDVRFDDDDDDDDGFHAIAAGHSRWGMPLPFSLCLSLSLSLSLVESENERTKRRQKPSSLAHSCVLFSSSSSSHSSMVCCLPPSFVSFFA